MEKRALVLLFSLFYLMPNFASASDDSQFDVTGVRLGMSADDVVATLAKHFDVGRDKLTIQKSGEFGHVSSIGYKGKNQEVLVYLAQMPPYGAQSATHAESITYSLESTPQNIDTLNAAVIEKYGEPDGWYGSSTWRDSLVSLEWCAEPTRTLPPRCNRSSQPIVEYVGSRVTLKNPKYAEIRSEFLNKSRSAIPKL